MRRPVSLSCPFSHSNPPAETDAPSPRFSSHARRIAEDVFALTGKDPLLDTALALRDAALKDEYFISRKLYPNVDFFVSPPLSFFPLSLSLPLLVHKGESLTVCVPRRAASSTCVSSPSSRSDLLLVVPADSPSPLSPPFPHSRSLAPLSPLLADSQRSLGFPTDFFPVLFAVPRVVGWLAHWRQMMLAGPVKIWRPRQVYVGEGARDYVGMRERGEGEQKGEGEKKKRGSEPSKVRFDLVPLSSSKID